MIDFTIPEMLAIREALRARARQSVDFYHRSEGLIENDVLINIIRPVYTAVKKVVDAYDDGEGYGVDPDEWPEGME